MDELHEKVLQDASPLRKLDLLLEAMGRWRNAAVECSEARLSGNKEKQKQWQDEAIEMAKCGFELYADLRDALERLEEYDEQQDA